MPARIICSPSWNYTELHHAETPVETGSALIEIIRRDGAEPTSDQLSGYNCWVLLDANIQATEEIKSNYAPNVVVEGYGVAYANIEDADYDECDWAYGILTDGTLMITHYPTKGQIAIIPTDELATEKLSSFTKEVLG